ncbi:MAG: DUF2062 domain-containing protein [Desulfobacterales bacterium]|nr:DUF2062 domain-containing protein [Desulfobacterales bacterium]
MQQNNSFSTEHIWCVIPVFNNKDTVKDIVMDCRSRLQQVVVLDDGSTDTDISALFSGSDVIVLRHEKNRGKGEAILTALRFIESRGGRYMITLDADGQHYPRDLEKFIPLLQDDDTAIVVGCRRFDGKNIPGSSRFGRNFANFWLRVETGVSIDDCQSGFRAYPVWYLSRMKLTGSYYDFEAEVLARAVWAGLQLKTVDIDVWYPKSQLRVSSFRPFVDNFRISCMHTRLVGRRLLPFPHRKLVPASQKHVVSSVLRHPVSLLKALLIENATPAGLAISAAMGTFLAALPLISIHTLVIIYVATRLHLNKVMAVNIQHLCMPPFVPLACIELGYYMRNGRWLTEVSLNTVFGQLTDRLFEWLLGSLVVAPMAAAMVGVSVFLVAQALQKRASSHAKS